MFLSATVLQNVMDVSRLRGQEHFLSMQAWKQGERRIRDANDTELLREILSSKAAEMRTWLRLKIKPHFK